MNLRIFILIIASVSLSALAQITLKLGMSDKATQSHQSQDWLAYLFTAFSNKFVILGLGLYGFGAVLWLLVLAKLDVTYAYPFVGIGFILTMLLGYFFLGESLTLTRIMGTLLVVSGVMLISRS